jgi:hypothetical protein
MSTTTPASLMTLFVNKRARDQRNGSGKEEQVEESKSEKRQTEKNDSKKISIGNKGSRKNRKLNFRHWPTEMRTLIDTYSLYCDHVVVKIIGICIAIS